jgi:rhodanese-related sulfurtransferase
MKREITAEELRSRLNRGEHILMVDVRTTSEYAAGHIPGAVNIPMDEVEARLEDLGNGTQVVLVCQSGGRAGITCGLLEPHHDNLAVLTGGTSAWENAGMPIVRTTSTRWSIDRQVRLIAGLIVLLGTLLAVTTSTGWLYVAMFIGAGLTFSGLTNFCGMALLLAKMPWNRPASRTSANTRSVCSNG